MFFRLRREAGYLWQITSDEGYLDAGHAVAYRPSVDCLEAAAVLRSGYIPMPQLNPAAAPCERGCVSIQIDL